VTEPARRAAVLGHPIAHSLSPALHAAAYRALGLDGWTYEWIDVTAEQLPGFVRGLDAAWAGLSLTMPLKQAVLPLLDYVEPLARAVGAVNTVLVQPSRPGVSLVGANTDVHGLVAALREGLAGDDAERSAAGLAEGSTEKSAEDLAEERVEGSTGGAAGTPVARPVTAAVLGGGATAASTLAALAELGVTDAAVYVRSAGRAGALVRAAHRMGVEPSLRPFARASDELAVADVVVATLPSHAADELAAALPAGPMTGVLLDVVYDPRPTALALAWAGRGGVVVPGERMLLHQAAEQVRLMTGRPAPLAAMDGALTEVLGAAG
jgi:shikimate dehydrogenase